MNVFGILLFCVALLVLMASGIVLNYGAICGSKRAVYIGFSMMGIAGACTYAGIFITLS